MKLVNNINELPIELQYRYELLLSDVKVYQKWSKSKGMSGTTQKFYDKMKELKELKDYTRLALIIPFAIKINYSPGSEYDKTIEQSQKLIKENIK